MALLEPADWSGRIFSGGWVAGGGQSNPAVEPATGRTLGTSGSGRRVRCRPGGPTRPARHRAEWAATSYEVRAAVLRRAADLLEQHEAEIADWAIRKPGIPRYWTPGRRPGRVVWTRRQPRRTHRDPVGWRFSNGPADTPSDNLHR